MLDYISGFLIIVILVILTPLNKCKKEKKKLAASIQLAVDTYIYNMPWDVLLFGKKKDLTIDIAKYSKKILEDDKKRGELENWYSGVIDDMPLEQSIHACQAQNCRWDIGLRKICRIIAIIVCFITAVIVGGAVTVKNDTIRQSYIYVGTMLLELYVLFQWLAVLISDFNEDMERLKEIDSYFMDNSPKTMEDLQVIQKMITENRKVAVKVPNMIYKLLRNNYEDKERYIERQKALQYTGAEHSQSDEIVQIN
jgi:hypothetical protein